MTVKKNHGNLGCFSLLPKEYRYSKKNIENQVVSNLGGKAATEIISDIADVSASIDFQKAFDIEKYYKLILNISSQNRSQPQWLRPFLMF